MKRNVNVFIAVVLCAALCGGIVWLQTASDEKLGWNIHDTYGEAPAYSNGAAYTNATFAGPSASEGGVMTLSSSRSFRARTSYSYASAYTSSFPSLQGGAGVGSIASSPNSLIASSPMGGGLYTTSSQTFKSYGGGGNGGAMGGSVSNGKSNSGLSNPSVQGGAGVGISPIAYSTARRGDMSSASGDDLAMMAAENQMASIASAANAGMGSGIYGYSSVMDYASADYGQYPFIFGITGRSSVRGRQNSSTPTLGEDPWWKWLDSWLGKTNGDGNLNGEGMGHGDLGSDGYYTGGYGIDKNDLDKAYEDFRKWCWEHGMGDIPNKEQWYEWYYQTVVVDNNGWYEYNGHYYFWTPVGDVLPLLLIALLYVLLMAIKSKAFRIERSE